MFGERLKLARKKAGLSLDKLVETLGGEVTKQALSKYERGLMMPGSKVLTELARALDVTLDYLLSEEVLSLEGIDFRKQVRTTVKERARVEAAVIDQLERYLTVEEILELGSAEWHAPGLESGRLESIEEAELAANELRDGWDLGDDPIPNMSELLEEHGIKVLMLDLPQSVSGLTCLVDRGDGEAKLPAIVVNERHGLERRRFTLAHELAHRVLAIPPSFSDKEEETAAHRFAGAFLMRADHLRQEVGKQRARLGYKEIIDLKRMYRVSAAALVVRLEQVGIIERSTLSTLFQTLGRTWRSQEPEEIELAERRGEFERPKRFERLSYWALAEGYISPAKAMELLNKPLSEIEEGMRGPGPLDAHHRQ
jgi:Zn-dependent peptidase ImmA (M78 family)/DNA-binding XRE family transcriptional regulator